MTNETMLRSKTSAAWLALALCGACTPALGANWIDGRVATGKYEIDDDIDEVEAEEAEGFDLRAQFEPTPSVFFRAQYLNSESDELEVNGTDIDDVDFEFDMLRGGVGLQGGRGIRYYGVVEYGEAGFEIEDTETEDDGVILSVGLSDDGNSPLLWNVEAGVLEFDDVEGGVFEVSLGYRLNPSLAIVVGAQGYRLEDDFDGDLDITHGTLGVRISF
ncbi:MAG: hypothetical protein ACREUE_05540 [Panacagrimonas sp.]